MILGRRGPLQVAFTIKELREMLHIRDCKACFDFTNFTGMNPSEIVKSLQRPRKRLTDLLFKAVMEAPTKKQIELWGDNPSKEWHLKLLRTPLEIHSDSENKVNGITLGINKLVGEDFTGKSLSEALIFASTNPQYDDILFIELQVQYVKIPSSEHGENMLCTEIDFDIQNNLCTQHVLPMFFKNKSF